ncbi:MAG: glucuronate isomerase [Candidatus Acidiferrum sp.]
MTFIHDDFLLQTKTAKYLYHKYAAGQPILDYHCHLPPEDIASNRQFKDLYEIWLEGDHYKWRAMRANGVAERYCTGDAKPYEKFQAWAATVPFCLRNPLYHWTHLEAKRYFGIDELLDEKTAPAFWKRANELLAGEGLRARTILKKFQVRALCTTDDPTSDLKAHARIAASNSETRVYPAFRPDRALEVHLPQRFNEWISQLESAAGVHVAKLVDFLEALKKCHDRFHQFGCRLSDHGLDYCYADFVNEPAAAVIFDKARSSRLVTSLEHSQFASYLMLFFGRLDAEKGWTKQLHLGALRNANTRARSALGDNMGFDSVGDWPQAQLLGSYLDRLEQENALPKMIIYNVNPQDNYVLATMAGNFQDGSVAGKIQFGSAWWFLDQKESMEWQMNALSNAGLLSRFIGMLTDSRSFMSFPRHEYFRRVLCNLLGQDMERGEIPEREDLIGSMIENICFKNAEQYLGLGVTHALPAGGVGTPGR